MLKAEATKELYSFNHLIEGIASMASGVKFSFFIALFIVLVAVGAAHEGHDHMAPAEPPSNHASSLKNHAMIGGLFPLLLTLLIGRERGFENFQFVLTASCFLCAC